jgi:antitoxin FitA
MEQEVRDLLNVRYGQRRELLSRIRQRTESLPFLSEEVVQTWKSEGRRLSWE